MKHLFLFAVFALSVLRVSFCAAEEPPNAELSTYYLRYFERVVRDEGLEPAERFLRRAVDYEDVSSDLSFELARVEDELGRPRAQVAATLERAFAAKRWRQHSEGEARLFKARLLLELCDYYGALSELDMASAGLEREKIALTSLMFLRRDTAFLGRAREALAVYPGSEDIEILVFRYAQNIQKRSQRPSTQAISLIERLVENVLARGEYGEVIYYAACFLSDFDNARRLLRAHLARTGIPPIKALTVLLNLGVYDEETAIDALFLPTQPTIDVDIAKEIYGLLRSDAAKDYFMGRLAVFSGILGEDRNGDGIFELLANYDTGMCSKVRIDAAQSRDKPIVINCKAGIVLDSEAGDFHFVYDAYPSVRRADMPDETFYFSPDEFFFAPVRFDPLCEDDGILFPNRIENAPAVSRRSLYAEARRVERPSAEFDGAVETLNLVHGSKVHAQEELDGKIVSETFFQNGTPLYQRVDTELDGRLETIRYFKRLASGEFAVDYVEVDREGFGTYLREPN